MQHSIELRRRSGDGLLKQPSTSDAAAASSSSSVPEDRGAAGFGLSNNEDSAAAAAARRSQQRKQQQRQRQRRVFVAAAFFSLVVLLTLFAASRRSRGHNSLRSTGEEEARRRLIPSRPGATLSSRQAAAAAPLSSSQQRALSPPTQLPLPPPSASCSPADARARLAFFRGRLQGFSFPTAAGEGGKGGEIEAQELIDQGWLLYRGFHRSAAAAAFTAALEISPSSSGAALGLAWSLGPGANLVAVDDPVPWPAFEAGRDFPLAAEAAARALRLAEEAERKLLLEEEEKEEKEKENDDEKEENDDRDEKKRRLRFLVQRDLSLARIAALRFGPGTSSGRARERAEAEAAAEMEEAARSLKSLSYFASSSSSSSSSSFSPSADPALLSLAAELRVHEAQWDYWELPEGQENADGGSKVLFDDETGWPSLSGSSGFLKMKPHAERAAALVREALALDPREPLALHLAVHLSEAAPPEQAAALGLEAADALAGVVRRRGGGEEEEESPSPRQQALEAAEAAAKEGTALLPPLSPKATAAAAPVVAPWISAGIPHLLHMPVHLFTRAGLYPDAVSSGIVASQADDAMAGQCLESYAVEHNAAALVFAALSCGRRRIAENQISRLRRSEELLGPAVAYAEGTVEVTLGISTEVLFADWGAIRRRRFQEAEAALEAEAEEVERKEKEKKEKKWWSFSSSPSSSSSSPSSLSTSKERGLCVPGGAEFAAAMKAAASALELAAAAEKIGGGIGGGGGGKVDSSLAEAAVRHAEELASALAAEPPTRPGGGPGIYACGHREVASGFAALARARLLLVSAAAEGKSGNEKEQENDGEKAAAARAAAKVLEKHELSQSRTSYMEPPRSQLPLAPCLGYLHLRAGDFDQAAEAFRRDLRARPANGRGLLGLALALEGLLRDRSSGDRKNETERERLSATARETRRSFERAWRGADAPLSSPCPALSE